MALKLGGETLRTLDEVLRIIAGRVPVLVEVKTKDRRHLPICFPVRRAIEGYRGPLAVMSFNPGVAAWFSRHAPKVVRGLVITEHEREVGPLNLRRRFEEATMLLHARPHFLAYDVRSLPARLTEQARREGVPVLTWTVRSEADRAIAATHADQIIYEDVAAA